MLYQSLISLGVSVFIALLSILGEILVLARTEISEDNHTRLIKTSEIFQQVKTFGPRLCLIALGADIGIGQFYFETDPQGAELFFWLAIITFALWVVTLLMTVFKGWPWLINLLGFGALITTVYSLL